MFSRIVEYKKAPGIIYNGPQCISAAIAQYIRSFLQDLRGRRKNFQKKVFFLDERQFWPILTRITECGRPQITFCQASQGIVAIIMQAIRSFP